MQITKIGMKYEMSVMLGHIALFTVPMIGEKSPYLTFLACFVSGERSLSNGLLVIKLFSCDSNIKCMYVCMYVCMYSMYVGMHVCMYVCV